MNTEYDQKKLAGMIADMLVSGKFQHHSLDTIDTNGFIEFCRERANNIVQCLPLIIEESKDEIE